ncbi:MAG TPA: transglycosylase SLT domain-containing protein, partial [Bryobacteraceae bacterium]|nr:transglycosylase SLT domain-containing protein [Bryobacteraceae bacterium]
RVENGEEAEVARDLAPTHQDAIRSPWSGKAWVLEARARKQNSPAAAVRVLREHYAELPQPEGDVTLADCYQAAGDLANAADFYQRVYYRYISGDASARAAAALVTLKDTMGAAYPQPLPAQMLERADKLMEAREYPRARAEYEAMLGQLVGVARDQARVRMGAADLRNGNAAAALAYLRGLELGESEADAERLYYVEECARRLGDEDQMMVAVKQLDRSYPQSPWRLRALTGAANQFLVTNRPGDYLPLYRAVYEDFPKDPQAGTAHWKVVFQAYLGNQGDARDLLREHVRRYPDHPTAGAALYFLARLSEEEKDFASAAAFYDRLAVTFPNTYYAILARDHLSRAAIEVAKPSPEAEQFLGSLDLPRPAPLELDATAATTARIGRARLLRTAGLNDMADMELRFGARNGGQPELLGMEMAESADAPYQGLRIMKSLARDYLNRPLGDAPRKYWELLFPLPYRADLMANAQANGLDPYVVAGLIRQESEFNPQAVSRASAYGLTQVRPGTGRLFARRAGVRGFTSRALFQPAINLRIGTTIFRSMLEQHGGSLEQTLASYNAGPNRVSQWLTWKTYREPAEFVESIPYTETRDYVQAVLRNADVYRRLYR